MHDASKAAGVESFLGYAEDRQAAMPVVKAVTIALPAPQRSGPLALEQCLQARRSVRRYRPAALPLGEVAQVLWAAQGVTSREGYRTAPSAGATFPLEVSLAVRNVEGLAPGVYRYRPSAHDLAQILSGDPIQALAAASGGQDCVRHCVAALIFSAVFPRTMARYGGRGRFYVWAEVGHAAQNVYLQATQLKLGTVAVGAFEPEQVRRITGLSAQEEALYIMPLGRL